MWCNRRCRAGKACRAALPYETHFRKTARAGAHVRDEMAVSATGRAGDGVPAAAGRLFVRAWGAVFAAMLPTYYLYTNPETRFAVRWGWVDVWTIALAVFLPAAVAWGTVLALDRAACRCFRGRWAYWVRSAGGLLAVYLLLRTCKMIAAASGVACLAPGGALSGAGFKLALYVGVPLALWAAARRRFPAFAARLCDWMAVCGLVFFVSAVLYPRHGRSEGVPPLPPPAAEKERGGVPNVILLLFDECAQDRLFPDGKLREDCPNLKAFCGTATTYLNCYAEGVETPISVPRLLLLDDSSFRNAPYPQLVKRAMDGTLRDMPSLFALATNHFRAACGVHLDYETWLGNQTEWVSTFLIVAAMSPKERILHLWLGAFPVLNRWLERPVEGETEGFVAAVQTTERLLPELLERARREPLFALVHIAMPHYPFVWDAGGLKEELAHRPIAELMDAPEGYEGNLRRMDVLLGDIVRMLREEGEFDRSLVVFTSDHAWRRDPAVAPVECRYALEDADPHSRYRRVPLVVKEPGQTEGRVVEDEFRARRLQELVRPLLVGGTAGD